MQLNGSCAVASPLHLNPIKGKETRKVTQRALPVLQYIADVYFALPVLYPAASYWIQHCTHVFFAVD